MSAILKIVGRTDEQAGLLTFSSLYIPVSDSVGAVVGVTVQYMRRKKMTN